MPRRIAPPRTPPVNRAPHRHRFASAIGQPAEYPIWISRKCLISQPLRKAACTMMRSLTPRLLPRATRSTNAIASKSEPHRGAADKYPIWINSTEYRTPCPDPLSVQRLAPPRGNAAIDDAYHQHRNAQQRKGDAKQHSHTDQCAWQALVRRAARGRNLARRPPLPPHRHTAAAQANQRRAAGKHQPLVDGTILIALVDSNTQSVIRPIAPYCAARTSINTRPVY